MVKLDSGKITALMQEQGLSVAQLASRAYLPPVTVQRALDGKFVDSMTPYKIAYALGVKGEELLAGSRRFDREVPDAEEVNGTIEHVTEIIVSLSSNKEAARSFCRDLVILGGLKGAGQK